MSIIRRVFDLFRSGKSTAELHPDIFNDLKKVAGKLSIIFDIGAHHGRFSVKVNNHFQPDRIYSFEPAPNSFMNLRSNLADKVYSVHQVALSNTEGMLDFHLNEFEETNSLLPSKTTGDANIDRLTSSKEVIKVQVTTIQNFCQRENIEFIDLLKIDVQGNSLNTLRGAERLLQNGAVKLIYCEVEFIAIYKGEALFHEITAYLNSFGYSLYSLYDIHYDIDGRASWADALYRIEK